MKKYHDQVLRNIYKLVVNEDDEYNDPDIYAELLTTAALPAHCYKYGFKNLNHLIDVVHNEQNTSMRDLHFLTTQAIDLLLARSAKQHHMPLKFLNYIVTQLEVLSVAFASKDVKSAQYILNDAINKLNAEYGWDTQHATMHNYEKDYPIPKSANGRDYYDADYVNPEYQAYWKKYFAFQRTVRFRTFYKFIAMFHAMLKQLNAIG